MTLGNGKQFSILGDSISTLAGYNPKGYKVFYADENCEKSGVKEMQDTWWGKVIDFFGGELLVNNSWSGSRVTRLPNSENLFPSGCSDERTGKLHINNVKPDVVIVYLGTNDWAFGAELDGTHLLIDKLNLQYFAAAYETMLEKIKTNYPNAEIWCCTLNTTFMSSNPPFNFPYEYGGMHIEKYNQIIKDTAETHKCKVIDLYSYHIPYDSIDGSHPNADGMNTLATLMIREIREEEVYRFLNCDNEHHQFSFMTYDYDQNYYGGYHVCEKCGKKNYENDYKYSSNANLEIGSVLNSKYELLKEIGGSGLSTVYLARDIRLNKMWAVKVVKDNRNNQSNSIFNSAIQEAQMMKSFSHPAIPNIVDIVACQNFVAIVMDYVEGETLETIVKEYGTQPVGRVVDWTKQICDVLGYLHSQNPPHIYRDMKPSNVMLQPNGSIKIVDFGLMRTYKPNQMQDTCNLGTIGYAAPEQFGGRGQSDARTDIYGLGMTMYHLLTGIDPKEADFAVKPICQINPSLPKGLEYIVEKCTQLDPANRYQSCVELQNDLNRYEQLPPKKSFFNKIFKH